MSGKREVRDSEVQTAIEAGYKPPSRHVDADDNEVDLTADIGAAHQVVILEEAVLETLTGGHASWVGPTLPVGTVITSEEGITAIHFTSGAGAVYA
jgi:hypothetical protein